MDELENKPIEENGSVNGTETSASVEEKKVDEVKTATDSQTGSDENKSETAEIKDSTEPDSCQCEAACKIESSPALDLSEAADRIEGEKVASGDEDESKPESTEKKETGFSIAKSIHSMNEEELLDTLKGILAANDMERHKEVTAIKQTYYSIINKQREEELEKFVAAGNDAEAFTFTPDATEEELKSLLSDFREKRNAYLEQKEAERQKNLEEKRRVIDALMAISEDIDTVNQQFPRFQQLQQEFKSIGEIPPGAENEIWKSYQKAVELFYDHLKMNKELRDLDFRKNLEIKNQLIEKVKGLAELSDPIEAFRILQVCHEQWRETGPVDREIREELWLKFKEASTVINKRHQDYYQNRKVEEQANEEAKTVLCEKAEAINIDELKTFADWDAATKEILALQTEWKGLGFASKKVNNALFSRFRGACDKFFEAKAEFFKKTKEESKENLAKKEALCEKAEALAEEYDRKGSLEEIQALQKEWKEVGVVRRKQGDEVWKRFCAALDKFYDARKKLFSGKREEETSNLNAKKEIIEKLKAISEESDRDDVIGTIRDLRDEWQSIGHVPFKNKDEINQAYKAELDRLYNAFDIKESRQRMRRFENEVKKLSGDDSKLGRERDKLVRALEARKNELKTIENNMGFFKYQSSSGNSMLKELEKKLAKLKEEVNEINEKIKLLDKGGEPESTEEA